VQLLLWSATSAHELELISLPPCHVCVLTALSPAVMQPAAGMLPHSLTAAQQALIRSPADSGSAAHRCPLLPDLPQQQLVIVSIVPATIDAPANAVVSVQLFPAASQLASALAPAATALAAQAETARQEEAAQQAAQAAEKAAASAAAPASAGTPELAASPPVALFASPRIDPLFPADNGSRAGTPEPSSSSLDPLGGLIAPVLAQPQPFKPCALSPYQPTTLLGLGSSPFTSPWSPMAMEAGALLLSPTLPSSDGAPRKILRASWAEKTRRNLFAQSHYASPLHFKSNGRRSEMEDDAAHSSQTSLQSSTSSASAAAASAAASVAASAAAAAPAAVSVAPRSWQTPIALTRHLSTLLAPVENLFSSFPAAFTPSAASDDMSQWVPMQRVLLVHADLQASRLSQLSANGPPPYTPIPAMLFGGAPCNTQNGCLALLLADVADRHATDVDATRACALAALRHRLLELEREPLCGGVIPQPALVTEENTIAEEYRQLFVQPMTAAASSASRLQTPKAHVLCAYVL